MNLRLLFAPFLSIMKLINGCFSGTNYLWPQEKCLESYAYNWGKHMKYIIIETNVFISTIYHPMKKLRLYWFLNHLPLVDFQTVFATHAATFCKIPIRVSRPYVNFGQISGPPLCRGCMGYLEPPAILSKRLRYSKTITVLVVTLKK